MRRIGTGLGLALALMMLFAVRVGAVEEGSMEGDQATGFNLKTLEGKPYGLKDAMGNKRPVLLYFCATWCKDCEAVMPQVKELARKYANRLNILAVNTATRDSLSNAIAHKNKNNLPYPVVFDEKDEVTEKYTVMGYPMFILVNPQGIITYRRAMLPPDMDKLLK